MRAHDRWLDAQKVSRPQYECEQCDLEEWSRELSISITAWDLLNDSNNDKYDPNYESTDEFVTNYNSKSYLRVWRATKLRELKKQIGESNYFSGTMPPLAPIWRFKRID